MTKEVVSKNAVEIVRSSNCVAGVHHRTTRQLAKRNSMKNEHAANTFILPARHPWGPPACPTRSSPFPTRCSCGWGTSGRCQNNDEASRKTSCRAKEADSAVEPPAMSRKEMNPPVLGDYVGSSTQHQETMCLYL